MVKFPVFIYELFFTKFQYNQRYFCVTLGKAEEVHNETIRLCDVQPYFCLLKIVEKNKSTDNPLEKDISHLIGKHEIFRFKNFFLVF